MLLFLFFDTIKAKEKRYLKTKKQGEVIPMGCLLLEETAGKKTAVLS